MNEKQDLEKLSNEIAKTILVLSIESQNEVFLNVRKILINERRSLIEMERRSICEQAERVDFAAKTLETVLIAPFDQEAAKKGY